MLDVTHMKNKVTKIKNKDGDWIVARLIGADDNYVRLRFKSGSEAYMSLSDIVFISPVKRQPAELV